MPENISQLIIPIVIFLFIIWLIYRIEKRMAKHAIYSNFPFLKDAVNSFQQKIDYLNVRIEAFEDRIKKLEQKPKG